MKLKHRPYGLSQSLVLWHDTIDGTLLTIGLTSTQWNACVYIHGRNDTLAIQTLYTDGISITARNKEESGETAEKGSHGPFRHNRHVRGQP